ncbi:uncharacterized protein LOC143281467 [Babylonia areolata]|uniref:uncharacterized protein LOC143281467 n=1 Tax=Babylonia areolata TaxID=304850 RepID=UPI003FD33D80
MTNDHQLPWGTVHHLSVFTACQLTLFLAMTSFMACNSQTDTKQRPEVGLSNATRTSITAGLGLVPRIKSRYSPRPELNRTHRQDFPDQQNKTSEDDDDMGRDTSSDGDNGKGPDLTSLFSSSSPDDLLEDAEIAELFTKGGMWTNNRQLKKKLKPYHRRLLGKGLVSRKTYRRFSRVILLLVLVFTVVGLVTNVLAVKVFRGLGKSVTNTYMLCLCSFDIAYLAFVVCAFVALIVVRYVVTLRSVAGHFLWLYDVAIFVTFSIRQVVIVTTALMSLDRYFSIASFFRTRRAAVLRRPRLLVGVCCLLVLVLNCPMVLRREVSCGRVEGLPQTACYLTYTPLYLNHRPLFDDFAIVSSCFFQYCPLLAMVVANVSLMVSLHRYSTSVRGSISCVLTRENSRAESCEQTPSGQQDTRPSLSSTVSSVDSVVKQASSRRQFFQLEKGKCVAVVAYSLLFFLLALPLALLPVLRKAVPEFNALQSQHYLYLTYMRSFNLLDTLSASLNFFVFFVKGGAFRAAVVRLVRCGRAGGSRRGTLRIRAADGTSSPGVKPAGPVWSWLCTGDTLSAVVLKRSATKNDSEHDGS